MTYDNYEERLLDTFQTLNLLAQATQEQRSCSLTRFSHAEISILSTSFYAPDWVKNWEYSLYQGATASPEALQHMLIESLKTTDISGLHLSTAADQVDRDFAVSTKELLAKLNIKPQTVCSPWTPHHLTKIPAFWKWLRQYPLALVGRRSAEAADHFRRSGIHIAAALNLEGCEGIDEVQRQLCSRSDWRIALVSAGIPATILVPRLAKDSGRTVIDFGHALDMIIEGSAFDFYRIAGQWNQRHVNKGE